MPLIPRAQLAHRPRDWGSMHLRNVGHILLDATALHSRRQSSSIDFLFCTVFRQVLVPHLSPKCAAETLLTGAKRSEVETDFTSSSCTEVCNT